MSTLDGAYANAFAHHWPLVERARARIPDGITSDSRHLDPFPPFFVSALGSRKVDVDGRDYIDLWSGHGALLFGHAAPEAVAAIVTQVQNGTHFGGCHELAVQWAEKVCELVPSAERVRFTGSGTEAVMLALHLARAFTGRPKVLRFDGHYHGWYAEVNPGSTPAGASADPVVARAQAMTVTCANTLEAATAALDAHPDIGAVILEPTGPCSGVVPLPPDFLEGLRERTHAHGSLLVFDEVVTGFRLAAGGAQALSGVTPDLTTLAKVAAGGMPGGAVAGRAEVMAQLNKHSGSSVEGRTPLAHLGTFTANPASAAAGVATLTRIADAPPYAQLARTGERLRAALNGVFDAHGLDAAVYGDGSCIKFLLGHGMRHVSARDFEAARCSHEILLQRGRPELGHPLRLALLLRGVDFSLSSFVTTAHTDRDVQAIANAFDDALRALDRDGLLHP